MSLQGLLFPRAKNDAVIEPRKLRERNDGDKRKMRDEAITIRPDQADRADHEHENRG